MKHKFSVVFMAFAMALCMAFGLSACGEETDETGDNPPVTDPSGNQGEQDTQKPDEGEQGTPAPHVHSYGEWEVTKEATCKEEGTKERSCACGEKETETLPLVGHDFEDMSCRWCGLKASLGLEYVLFNGNKEYAVLRIGNCTDTDLVITNNYQGKPVTWIADYAFFHCSGLTSVTIPNSVTSIGSGAFEGCGLTEINVDENNHTYHAQGNCLIETKSKTLIAGCKTSKIPDDGSVTSIGYWAFSCHSVTSITIPDSVTSIGDGAFSDCDGLTSVTIGNGVTSIGAGVFEHCYGLTSVTIGNGVTSIGAGVFEHCYGLTSVTIGSSVTSIGDRAFEHCYGLTSVTIPDSVTDIGPWAFDGCNNLKEVHFKNPNGWKVSWYEDISGAEAVLGLNNPATAAEYLTGTYVGFNWKREV